MTKFDNKEVTAQAAELFDLQLHGEGDVSADLRYAVYSAVLYKGDDDIVDIFLRVHTCNNEA